MHANYGGFLTPAELRELGDAIQRAWQPYLERLADPAQRPDGARLVHMFVHGYPRADEVSDLDAEATGAEATGAEATGAGAMGAEHA